MEQQIVALKAVIANLPTGQQDFATSLCTQWERKHRLSEKQIEWVGKLIDKATAPQPVRERVTLGDFASIAAMFVIAGSRVKYPKITMSTPDGQKVQIKLMSGGKYPGSLIVTDGGKFGSNRWFGRIHKDGTWEKPLNTDGLEPVADLLATFAKSPEKTAAEYGKRSGHCCFCNRHLTDTRSLEVGYGKTCSETFGLDWG